MELHYLAQDELDVLDDKSFNQEKKNYKDPVEIIIKITVEKSRYNSVLNRRKTPLPEYINSLLYNVFKPSK